MFGEIKHRARRQRSGSITIDDVVVHICYDLPEQSSGQSKCFATGGVSGHSVIMGKAGEQHNRVQYGKEIPALYVAELFNKIRD